jgi:hypothetical protein
VDIVDQDIFRSTEVRPQGSTEQSRTHFPDADKSEPHAGIFRVLSTMQAWAFVLSAENGGEATLCFVDYPVRAFSQRLCRQGIDEPDGGWQISAQGFCGLGESSRFSSAALRLLGQTAGRLTANAGEG